MKRKQVYEKYNIDTEKQKFLDPVPLNKIIKYEEFNKSLREKKGYFDEIFPPGYVTDKEYNKYDQRCEKCKKTENYKVWKNCLEKRCYPQNEEGAIFYNVLCFKEWIPWKTYLTNG